MKGDFAISDADLAKLFWDDVKEQQEAVARECFKKPYKSLTGADLNNLTEELLKGMLMFRKNAPFGFVRMVNLVLGHPNTSFLTKNSLRVCLDMFDFDLNELNSDKFIVEQDVDLAEGIESEKPLEGQSCHQRYFGSGGATQKQVSGVSSRQ